jgi:hypothetical protein
MAVVPDQVTQANDDIRRARRIIPEGESTQLLLSLLEQLPYWPIIRRGAPEISSLPEKRPTQPQQNLDL